MKEEARKEDDAEINEFLEYRYDQIDPLRGRADWVLRYLLDQFEALDYTRVGSTKKKSALYDLQLELWPRICRCMWAAGPIRSLLGLQKMFAGNKGKNF